MLNPSLNPLRFVSLLFEATLHVPSRYRRVPAGRARRVNAGGWGEVMIVGLVGLIV